MKEITDCIFYADKPIVKVDQKDIGVLIAKAHVAKTVRSRLCMHEDPNSDLHEMFIVHFRDTYVRPHKHLGKPESIHIIEGAADIIIFDNHGEIKDVVNMGEYRSGRRFYYRMDGEFYHTVLIDSDTCVFHETTKGPFDRDRDTVVAPWSPSMEDSGRAKDYMDQLRERKKAFKAK